MIAPRCPCSAADAGADGATAVILPGQSIAACTPHESSGTSSPSRLAVCLRVPIAGIVGVPAVYTLRRAEVVAALETDPGDVLDEVHKLVDRYQLAGPEVDGLEDIACSDGQRSLEAVIYVHEGPRLVPVAPDFNAVVPRRLGVDHLAADRGGRLLPPAFPGPVRAVHVVKAGNTGRQPEVFAEVPAHPLGEELLPAVAVFGHRGVGVLFAERDDILGALLICVVHTR